MTNDGTKTRNWIPTTVYLSKSQIEELRSLKETHDVTIAAAVRRGVALAIEYYKKQNQ